jgi:hypothetical protein
MKNDVVAYMENKDFLTTSQKGYGLEQLVS